MRTISKLVIITPYKNASFKNINVISKKKFKYNDIQKRNNKLETIGFKTVYRKRNAKVLIDYFIAMHTLLPSVYLSISKKNAEDLNNKYLNTIDILTKIPHLEALRNLEGDYRKEEIRKYVKSLDPNVIEPLLKDVIPKYIKSSLIDAKDPYYYTMEFVKDIIKTKTFIDLLNEAFEKDYPKGRICFKYNKERVPDEV